MPRAQWIYWDLGFLIWGAAMLVGGWALWRAGRRETASAHYAAVVRPPEAP